MSETNQKTKNKKNKILPIIIILSAVIMIGAGVTIVLLMNQKTPETSRSEGVVGVITDGWDTNVSDQQDGEASKPGTQIPGYYQAEMNEGDTTLKLRVGNPKNNTVGFFATVKLSDGTVLYSSPLLEPGHGLEEIPLNQTLSKGTYDALVFYQCVLLNEENTPLNAAESGFTLIVH